MGNGEETHFLGFRGSAGPSQSTTRTSELSVGCDEELSCFTVCACAGDSGLLSSPWETGRSSSWDMANEVKGGALDFAALFKLQDTETYPVMS